MGNCSSKSNADDEETRPLQPAWNMRPVVPRKGCKPFNGDGMGDWLAGQPSLDRSISPPASPAHMKQR